MAVPLRLSEQETEARREQAEAEHRSMQDVVQRAVRESIERHRHRNLVEAATAVAVTQNAEALRELGGR